VERESLATASRFAQLFYWMLESKHPLFLFGIPGIILFVLGYRLSGNLTHIFTELNTTSIGVTLATIAMTLIGLFAMMIAIILYILGKQVKRIQSQYNWTRNS
jgi:membrane-bound ClpP family serine protease